MKFHSSEYVAREEEFKRVLILACMNTTQLLIYSPNNIDSLDHCLEHTFGAKYAKELKKNRKLIITTQTGNVEIYLEAGRTKSGFSKGNILLPWTSELDTHDKMKDYRATNTYYIPHTGPNTAKLIGTPIKDELTSYLQSNPSSTQI